MEWSWFVGLDAKVGRSIKTLDLLFSVLFRG
jgi:hypothetical protein